MRNLIFTLITMTAGAGMVAQDSVVLPEGMEILTPDGVTVTIGEQLNVMDKKMAIAGSKEKGYKAYFTASDDAHGEELWVSDGTKSGTMMVKDIRPGSVSSDVRHITRFNDKVVFSAISDDETGAEVWISDGTEEGTYMLLDINILGDASPKGFCQVNETQFIFGAKDFESATYGDTEQWWLWVSDGTEEGTHMIKDCQVKYPGKQSNSFYSHFVRVGRKVFFKGDSKDCEFGEALYVTDGTEEGTLMLADINKQIADESTGSTAEARIDWMTNFHNERLFFCAYSDEYGNEPWTSDGTPEGTYLICDISKGVDASGLPNGHGAYGALPMGDHVYFRGNDPANAAGLELCRTDFTEEGTELVADLNLVPSATGTNASQVDILCVYDGVLFMKANTGVNPNYDFCKGIELFYSDGTTEGTKLQSDLNPGVGNNAAWEGTVVSGSMFFRAQDETQTGGGGQKWELFRIDDKDQFPVKVVDLGPGADYVHTLRNMCGDLLFTSKIIPSLFKYHYRKPDYDPVKDLDEMDPEYRTRAEMASVIDNTIDDNNILLIYNGSYVQIVTPDDVLNTELIDIAGRTILRDDSGNKSLSVKSAGVGDGIYIVKVTTVSQTKTKRIVVK